VKFKAIKRIFCGILSAVMSLTLLPQIPVSAKTGSTTYTFDGYKVEYSVMNEWDKNQNIGITITNTGKETIENWAIKYDASGEISNLWNGKINKKDGTSYIIENAGYNSEIKPNQTVNFGYQLTSEKPAVPSSYSFCTKRVPKTEGYTVTFSETGGYGSDVTGNITITNTTDKPIKAWELTFESDFKINNIWNAKLISSDNGKFVIKNAEDTSVIQRNSSVTFGLQCKKTSEIKLNNAALSEVIVSDAADEPTEELVLFAYGEYNKQTNSIVLIWESSVPKGKFDVLISSDGKDYSSAVQLTDADTYNYVVDGTSEKIYFKIKETTADNKTAESAPFIMAKTADGYEFQLEDTDKDGLPDIYEEKFGTDISKPDTDGDGLTDYQEVYLTETDPLKVDTDTNGINDGDEDTDKDGLTALEEIALGTEPSSADTDNDGLNDGDELNNYTTDPLKYDTDEDDLSDGDEIKLELNPLSSSTNGVPDNQYTIQQSIPADSEAFSEINTDENSYDMSLDIKAAGNVEGNITVSESGYSNVMKNDAILGVCPELVYSENFKIDSVMLKFKVDDEYISNDGSEYAAVSPEFEGIKRYNIFKYFEDINMFLPVKTEFNVQDNTLYTTIDSLGTYCVIDMEKWLKGLGIEAEDQETTDNIVRSNLFMMPAQNETDDPIGTCGPTNTAEISSNSTDNSNIIFDEVKADQTTDIQTSIQAMSPTDNKTLVKAPTDIVFILQSTTDITRKKYYEQYKSDILVASKEILKKIPNARISVIEYNETSSSYLLTDEAKQWAYNYEEMVQIISKSVFTDNNVFCNMTNAYRLLLNEKQYRTGATRFAFMFYTGESYYGGIWKNYTLDDVFTSGKYNYSELMPIGWKYKTKEQEESVIFNINKCKGIFLTTNDPCGGTIYNHIYNNTMPAEKKLNAILATGLEEVILDEPLSDSDIDTDEDGLRDWDEVDTQSELIKWNTDGSIVLPTFKDCIDKKGEDLFYVKEGLERFFGDNPGNPYYNVYYTEVLPIVSDPTDEDGDEDFLSDYDEIHGYKTNPLTIDSDFDFLSDNDEINTFLTDPTVADEFLYPIPVTAKTKYGTPSYISSKFGYRSNPTSSQGETQKHWGIDIAATNGTPIYATSNGRIIKTNKDGSWGGGYGNYIQINHNNALKSKYAHCESVCVNDNGYVKKGNIIGYVGSTGDSSGNHLHFEIYQNGERVDPLNYVSYHTNK